MKNIVTEKAKTAKAKTKSNLSRLHEVLDNPHTVVKVDCVSIYLGRIEDDESGNEHLILELGDFLFEFDGSSLVFSSESIEQGTVRNHSFTMTADDGVRHELAFFTTKLVKL